MDKELVKLVVEESIPYLLQVNFKNYFNQVSFDKILIYLLQND